MDTPTEIKDCGLELTFICTESAGVRYSVRKLMRRMRWGIILLITINMETENEYEKENPTPDEPNRFPGEYMKQYSWAEVTLA